MPVQLRSFPGSLCRALAICLFPFTAFSQGDTQKAPLSNVIDSNAKATVFAEGVISTPYTEWATSFSPDGKTVYSSQGAVYWTIVSSTMTDGKWTKPKVAPFSGQWNDTDPFVSPDGKRLFFISNRPMDGASHSTPSKNYHIWYVDHLSGDEWSSPHHLEAPVNIEGGNCYAPSVSRSGTLYFCARDRDGHAGMSSYACTWLGTHYDTPKLLTLNGNNEIQDPFIAPDESYLVFVSGNDILISFHQGDSWSAVQNLGPEVNNGDGNSSPYVSADGKMLYYSSNRIRGFYKRNREHALDYDGLIKEMQSIYNSGTNILMIPINLRSL
jgi:Tol biopolymer transport system component